MWTNGYNIEVVSSGLGNLSHGFVRKKINNGSSK